MKYLTKLILCLGLWISAGHSQTGDISLESKIDRAKITIGDRITYSIIVKRAENVDVELPEVGTDLGAFEILSFNDPELTRENGMVIQKRDYIISTFDTGEYEIPPVVIRYVSKPDTTWRELMTEKIQIEVESLKPSETGDIRDIKAPLELKRDYRALIRWAIIGLAILLLGSLSYYFIKRWGEGKGLLPRKEKPLRPAHELALEELDRLVNSDLLAEGKIKQFYIELSEIVRTYIEGRFYIMALEMTTSQLIENMRRDEIDAQATELIAHFLEACDMVKFAKYVPATKEHEIAIHRAYEIVNTTKIEIISPEGDEATKEFENHAEQTIAIRDIGQVPVAKEVE